jgi:hypothetical protein
VILSRIDRLQAEVKSVLQCASVIGRVFQHRLLGYLSGQSEALEGYLSHLEAHELVYRERIVPELEYAFKHALTQETAYEGILTRHRRSFHERVGEGIEALYQEQLEEYYELLAFHYGRSDNREKAIEYLDKAAQKAAARYANQEALRYFEQALELARGDEAYDLILARRARLRVDLFQGKEAAGDYERLLESARQSGNRKQEIEALLGLAGAQYVISLDDQESDTASRYRELYEAAYALARELGDKTSMVRALLPTQWFRDVWPEYAEQATANIEEALVLSQEIGEEELIVDSQLATLNRLFRTAPLAAEELAEELLTRLKGGHDLLRLKELHYLLMWTCLVRGHFESAIEHSNAGIQLAEELGVSPVQYPTLKARALVSLGCYGEAWDALQQEPADEAHRFGAAMKEYGTGSYLLELMAYEKASAVFRSVIEQASRLHRAWMRNGAQGLLARSLIRAGQLGERNLSAFLQQPEMAGAVLPPDVLAEMHLCDGSLDEALEQVENVAAQAKTSGREPAHVAALELKLRILLRLDRAAEARDLAEEALRMAEAMGYLPRVWRLRAGKAQALEALADTAAAAREYQAAAAVIRGLADTIGDAGLKEGFLSDPLVASIFAAADRDVGTKRR